MSKFLLLFILLMLMSCNQKANSTIIENPTEFELDTLKDNEIYFLDTIQAKEFFSLAENENVFCNCYEDTESYIDDSNVKRNVNILSFQLKNGETKEFVNNTEKTINTVTDLHSTRLING